ncbi:hypothetical protein ACS0TY_015018 [Phlomoides rotata]
MCLENIHDSGHSEERPLTMSADAVIPNTDPATQEIRPLPCSWPQDDKDGSQPIAYIRSSEFRRKEHQKSRNTSFSFFFSTKYLRLKVENELRLCWVLLKGFRTTVSPVAVE